MDENCFDPANLIDCTVGSIAQGELENFARDLMQGANDMWTGFFTSWITSGLDGIVGGYTADWFAGITMPVQAFLLALGLMIAGVRTALLARGDVAADAAKRFLRAILISVAGVTFFSVMQTGSNALAKSILEAANGGSAPNLLWDEATFSANIALALIFGLLGVFAIIVQWIIMILRAVAVSVLLPFWPLTAAGAMFERHEGMFEKTTGWLLAFLLYSPVAASLYGLAIKFREGRDGVEGAMIGVAIFVLAIFALPALMRLVVPVTSAMGRASAGAMAASGARTALVTSVAVGSAVATGGAAAPAAGAAAKSAGTSSAAAAGSSTAAGGAGSAGPAGAAGSAGGSGPAGGGGSSGSGGPSGSGGSSGSSPSGSGSGSSSSSGRSGWDTARDLGNAIPSGSRGVGEMIDE
ncbi:hypothetical protein ALI44B_00255 [Leifsonia sp. ALI-44-B]|uniref:hypothetical protein n=1 Tax=Leifsonia sp. ALI-44-B TaxID=1933776 RepID=UPI00097CB525|nr:hypothetical protein [Leifsonia sp. ALI-44-B]ONI65424.1 hypothetical protein ALI44B_00255 [Leifsonia sp. ALI-44-B]